MTWTPSDPRTLRATRMNLKINAERDGLRGFNDGELSLALLESNPLRALRIPPERYEFTSERAAALSAMGRPLQFVSMPRRQLVQEALRGDRWAVAVATLMCCRTKREQSHQAVWKLLSDWPTPDKMAGAYESAISYTIRRCGLVSRAKILIEISRACVEDCSIEEVNGVGEYMAQALRLFGDGLTPAIVDDAELARYAAFVECGGPWYTRRARCALPFWHDGPCRLVVDR